MMLTPPKFWWRLRPCWKSYLLQPLAWVWQLGATIQQAYQKASPPPVKAPWPVISIGNLTLGGAGKTPTTLALASLLQHHGKNPCIITRGYGGNQQGPILVAPYQHTPQDVGDEALLLAKQGPTWVSKVRSQAIPEIQAQSFAHPVVLLDDGHQHHTLIKDVQLLVIDGVQGLGNQQIFPAGPLREPLEKGLQRSDGIILVGSLKDCSWLFPLLKKSDQQLPIFEATLAAQTTLPPNSRVVGFAGIGFPQKFQKTLEMLGHQLVSFHSFPDHHPYTSTDLKKLAHAADTTKAILVTTEKDYVKLPAAFQQRIHVVKVNMVFQQSEQLWLFLQRHFPQ